MHNEKKIHMHIA